MLNISVRAIQRRLQDFDLLIRASQSPINDSELDDVVAEIIKVFPKIGYRIMLGELGRRKIKVTHTEFEMQCIALILVMWDGHEIDEFDS